MRLYCADVNDSYIKQNITVMGWVANIRNLGGLLFCDIRDRSGIIQIYFPDHNPSLLQIGKQLKPEFVVQVSGEVIARPQPNLKIASGKIELIVSDITILNTAQTMPILINDITVNEEARLKYRILDLRGDFMQKNILIRHQTNQIIRNFLTDAGFIEIETPLLTKPTPEGARDFLVPARLYPNTFYALPQSPQLFKQLLMIAGFDKYFQIARCFRDEDLRGDRQPEFTQIDIETSFLSATEIRLYASNLIKVLFKKILNLELGVIPELTYQDAITYYGCDKPDLRFNLKFIELKTALKDIKLDLINNVIKDNNSRVIGLNLKQNNLSRKELSELSISGLTLFYFKVSDKQDLINGISSSINKFLTPELITNIISTADLNNGDLLLFAAGKTKEINAVMSNLRLKLAEKFNLYQKKWAVNWVVDFPLFEYDDDNQKYTACHHPFTAAKHQPLNLEQPLTNIANAYDLVINGIEVGGGSIRINNLKTQQQVFDIIGIDSTQAQDKFGFLLDNLKYGAPPHGGVAFGLDRIVALLCGCEHIRDVIAFPKTNTGQCLLTNAPHRS